MTLLRDESSSWGRRPQTPEIYRLPARMTERRQIPRPPLIPAAESALGLRPRSALSSAQVFPEWITTTSPCNDLSANGDNPLNFVSHSRGSVHLGDYIRLMQLQQELDEDEPRDITVTWVDPKPGE